MYQENVKYQRLVELVVRAFYAHIKTQAGINPKFAASGIAVVVLDALTRRHWVREEDLAKDLKMHSNELRKTLSFFEEEKIVLRDCRKETAKGAKLYSAAIAATADGQQTGREGEKNIKLHTHSYCCLNYAQIYDVVRYRLHHMRKTLKVELENKNRVQEYRCPGCGKRYTALDALQLVSPEDGYFHCESCNSELVAESDKLAAKEMGDGDDNARRRHHEEQLKPLMDQLTRVENLDVPDFGTLQAWELRANAAVRAAGGDPNANDSSKSLQGLGYGGTPMPFLGETKMVSSQDKFRALTRTAPNYIGKSPAPVGAHIKRILDLLRGTRQAFTPDQVEEIFHVDAKANKAVFDSLRNSPKVHYDGKHFSYKPKHDLKDKNQLLVLVRKYLEGIAVCDLKDAYPTVMEDLQALKEAGEVWLVPILVSQVVIAYPNDPRTPIKVDEDLKEFFWSIKLPRERIDLETYLLNNGMKPAINTAERKGMAEVHGVGSKRKTKKKHEISKRTKLTNAHLPELLQKL